MTDIVFYFQVHQPFRLRKYSFFDIGKNDDYFDDELNEFIAERVAERCYLPVNEVLLRAIEATDGRFRCSFSISGTALRQFEQWVPEVIESYARLVDTGCVELLCETSHHSLASRIDRTEFVDQVKDQRQRLKRLFGVEPRTFRNTELIFDEGIARTVEDMGFATLLGEGADQLLGRRSPHGVYRPRGCEQLNLLLRDYEFSDDIAFRFSNREWDGYPLMADTYAKWLGQLPEDARFVGLFMDYETFGEHQAADTGILDFLEYLPGFVLENPRLAFATPDEVSTAPGAVSEIEVPRPISWADAERDLTAWLGNPMQRAAHEALADLLPAVRAADPGTGELLERWRRLSTSDHVYYMSTKWFSDGDVHEYFSPYDTPHDAFILFMNVLDDLGRRLESRARKGPAARSR